MQPDFERIKAALFCREPDRVPLAELKVDRAVQSAFLGRVVESLQDEIEFWAKAGYDYIRIRPTYDFHQRGFTEKKAEYGVYGDRIATRRWAVEGKGLITNDRDFAEFPWPAPDEVDYSSLEAAADMLYDGMRVISGVTGIFEGVWMLMGLEGFAIATAENPALIRAMFDKVGDLLLGVFEQAVSYPHVGAMWVSDDLAYTEGLFISPEMLREHVFPRYKRMGDMCRERRMPFLFHSDGRVWDIMGDIIGAGFNALHPIEPKAMDIRELKRRVGDRLCLMGNLDLGGVLTRGSPEEVAAATRDLIRDLAPGGGYCVGSSNTVPEYVPLENYRAMIDATIEFGKYPIR